MGQKARDSRKRRVMMIMSERIGMRCKGTEDNLLFCISIALLKRPHSSISVSFI